MQGIAARRVPQPRDQGGWGAARLHAFRHAARRAGSIALAAHGPGRFRPGRPDGGPGAPRQRSSRRPLRQPDSAALSARPGGTLRRASQKRTPEFPRRPVAPAVDLRPARAPAQRAA